MKIVAKLRYTILYPELHHLNMQYQHQLIEVEEYADFFTLIDLNRTRLQKYFPNTVNEISSLSAAKKHLEENLKMRERKEKYLFGLYAKGVLMGYVNVKNIDWRIPKCELGYFIDRSYGGRQIMTEKLGEICDYCFSELKMTKIFLRIGRENIGSIKVAERNGFIQEGILRKEFRVADGTLIDVLYFGKLKTIDIPK